MNFKVCRVIESNIEGEAGGLEIFSLWDLGVWS